MALSPLNPPIRDWPGRRVWIVGASTGIGAAMAADLLARGARVALSARSPDALGAIAASAPPSRALALPLDVLEPSALADAHARIVSQWGGVDLVVWMAGRYVPMPATEFDLPAARAVLETNLSLLNALPAILPPMLAAGRGAIAIVASVAGYRGLPRSMAYGATKAAMINLAETLHLELRPRGIGVHLVNPGFVDTPMTSVNDFRMPAMIDAAEAARRIVEGLERGDFETHFPRRFTWLLKLARALPDRIYFALARRATASATGSATGGRR